MKHRIKNLDGTVQTVEFSLGTGFKDRHYREIFEGDNVKININALDDDTAEIVTVAMADYNTRIFSIMFKEGNFFIACGDSNIIELREVAINGNWCMEIVR